MSGGLQEHDGGGAPARCSHCGAIAAGPCARCRRPTCGDCCVLTEGGVGVFAVCLACNKKGGRSLTGGWWIVVAWLVGACLLLFLVNVVLRLVFR